VTDKRRTGNSNRDIAALATRQHGVVSRRQLRALGLTDRAITARTASGVLHPLFHGTFTVGHRAISRSGWMLAAVLSCGDGAVLSHGSAAELIGLWDKQAIPVDVIVPRRSGRKIQDVRWHHVLLPSPEEIEIRDGIPCTTPSRTLVDLAGRVGERSLRRLVQQAAVLRLLDVRAIDRTLARGRRQGAPQLRGILVAWRSEDESPPRLRSLLEARLLPALVEAGLPQPQSNVKLRIDGKLFEVDFLWKDQRLVIETDGEETHGTRMAFEDDRRRDQVLASAGYRTARITWRQLEDELSAVITRIERMFTVT
jgi:very-short-patch-repair endonuclease